MMKPEKALRLLGNVGLNVPLRDPVRLAPKHGQIVPRSPF